jgi:flagellar biosynthetic protein FliQ
MNPYLSVAAEALEWILILSLPPLLASLVVGLVISLLQALTQVQEQTLTLVPKIIATIVVLIICANWIMLRLEIFTLKVFDMIAYVGRGL